jgi:hypothetical protein
MFKLDDNLLRELGLGELPVEEKNKMLAHIYETLEMRVGMRLAEQMTDEQLDEFEKFIDTNDEAGALKWLETNFPDYKQVVADELEKLKNEIRQHAGAILQAARQDGATAPQQAQAAQQAMPQPAQQPLPQQDYQQQYQAPQPAAQSQYDQNYQQPPQYPQPAPQYPPQQQYQQTQYPPAPQPPQHNDQNNYGQAA